MKSNSGPIKLGLTLLLVISALAYGLSLWIPIVHSLCILAGIIVPSVMWYMERTGKELAIVTEYEEELARLDGVLSHITGENEEMKLVLSEYEQIFDSQVAEIPCNCNDNTFRGIFSPSLDNIVDCEKCKNKYKITMNYDTVLMTEPLDNDAIFASLKTSLE